MLDKNLRFDDLKRILEHYGYAMKGPSSGGSHKTFRKSGSPTITIPQHKPIKAVYVEMVKEIVEREEENNEEKEKC